MACFPGLAAAEENSGIQYETDVPTVPDNQSSNIPSKKNSGGSDRSDASDAEASGSNSAGGAGGSGGSGTGGGADNGQGTQASGGGDGQSADGTKPAGDVGSAKSLPLAASPAEQASAEADGSSPLVPILIAVAVLAAISIGAYYYRQRRQDPGSPVSPNAS